VWGVVATMGTPCSDVYLAATPLAVQVDTTIQFTACDEAGMPVDHALPHPEEPYLDGRRFTARLLSRGATADAKGDGATDEAINIEYVGRGRYDVTLRPTTHGDFDLHLSLTTPTTGLFEPVR
jgi:hypothetical protein